MHASVPEVHTALHYYTKEIVTMCECNEGFMDLHKFQLYTRIGPFPGSHYWGKKLLRYYNMVFLVTFYSNTEYILLLWYYLMANIHRLFISRSFNVRNII